MQDDDKAQAAANPQPSGPNDGARSKPPETRTQENRSRGAAGGPAATEKVEGWINDPRAPAILVGVILFLFFIAVVSS